MGEFERALAELRLLTPDCHRSRAGCHGANPSIRKYTKETIWIAVRSEQLSVLRESPHFAHLSFREDLFRSDAKFSSFARIFLEKLEIFSNSILGAITSSFVVLILLCQKFLPVAEYSPQRVFRFPRRLGQRPGRHALLARGGRRAASTSKGTVPGRE